MSELRMFEWHDKRSEEIHNMIVARRQKVKELRAYTRGTIMTVLGLFGLVYYLIAIGGLFR